MSRFAEALVGLTSEALVALDAEARILSWNHGATLVFGWSTEEARGREAGGLIAPEGREAMVRELITEASATGSACYEGVARTKSGDEIHVEAVVRVVPASGGIPGWIALTARDTTERTLLLREVFEQNLRLETTLDGLRAAEQSLTRAERFALAGQLAASVCHSLRNPLGAIRNGLYYVRKRVDPTADERLAAQLGIMEREIATGAKLIGDLLERVREPSIERAPTAVHTIVDDALGRVSGLDWVTLHNEVPGDLGLASVDAQLLARCVTNLVQNGVEAFADAAPTGRGGSVTITAARAGGRLELRVDDDGCGIPADILPRVTAPLFTTKADRPGAGLSIAENIVGRHGGELTVRARDGGGTTVAISIPEAFDP